MVRLRVSGNYDRTFRYFNKLSMITHSSVFDRCGKTGVEMLRNATPVESGKTADSWSYEVVQNGERISVEWHNSHINKGVNIAIILQLGHGTGTGGWVEGRDYINPALQPAFDQLLENVISEVKNA